MRRVVMGSDEHGKAVVLADEEVEATEVSMLPGFKIHRVYELNEAPSLPVEKPTGPVPGDFYPAPDGLRFGLITVPAHTSYELPEGMDPEEAIAEAEAKLPGGTKTFDPERPGVHTTPTVDFLVVVSGRGRMRTDYDVDIHLEEGDCLIQNGTAHGWFNDSDEPFVMGYVLCGAR